MTSDWVEDKVIFWGRPIETKWDKSTKSDWPAFNIYTTIEVVEEVKGKLPKKIKVNHAIDGSSCGILLRVLTLRMPSINLSFLPT